ncbi:MAG: outer membrane protein (porin) [bacterium]|nr:MAG: outer membrane protein (porin) [bacterium]KAF0148452.1 MAG: outer membrane protein (porin) [bacterium]KAF0167996.1 MAG: outer membrane protein (porin) [bacterium]TXT21259.1 MAG: outer membrane protein (porin) [bacterium]
MKKSLIALAVAGSFAAPAAFAATANVDVYGIMNIAVEDKSSRKVNNATESGNGLAVQDNYSRIGFKGSEDLGGGLKALWQIESQLSSGPSATNNVDGVTGNSIATRNTFIGLSGGFGTVLAGRHDTPYKIATLKYDIFGDTLADYNLGRLDGVSLIDGTHDHRSPDAIAYISPNWSGFTVAAALVSTNQNGNLDADQQMDAYSLALMYANGPLTVDAGYQDVDQINSKAWKIGVGYTFGDLKLGFVYEDVTDRSTCVGTDTDAACAGSVNNVSAGKGSGLDRDSWLVNAAYNMGAITLKALYGQADVDVRNAAGTGKTTQDQDMWAIGADYALSKRTTAYVVYGDADNDEANGSDQSGWTIGMRHSF